MSSEPAADRPDPDPTQAPVPDAADDAERPLRVAVVGSGPSGIYTCDALHKWSESSGREVAVDLVERLPVPFGLLRYGVAPDHPRIKSVARVLREIVDRPEVRFLGGVEFGTDLTVEDVAEHYDALVVCTGAIEDRRMGIPGEDLTGSYGAAEFVTWYDGHPDAPTDHALHAERVAVVGAGNVALDVARMLVRSAAELDATDVPEAVRTSLADGGARCVWLLARRGPEHAKFTPQELRELGGLEGVHVIVDPVDLDLDAAAAAVAESDRHVVKDLDRLREWAADQEAHGVADPDAAEAAALAAGEKVIRFRFHAAPVEVLGDGEQVTGLRVERTVTRDDGTVEGTGQTDDLSVQAVYRAVGYRSSELPGLPFDDGRATIPHEHGRVGRDGTPIPGVYTAGWIKRGPSGVIGTNRACAADTVEALVEDVLADAGFAPAHPEPEAVTALLAERGVEAVVGDAWHRIDLAETELGAQGGRERTKIVDRDELLRIAREG